jgi:hypothetical protein
MAAREPRQLAEKELACPTCKAYLKKRRARKPDVCEMICGGCGEIFDICELETADKLRNSAG